MICPSSSHEFFGRRSPPSFHLRRLFSVSSFGLVRLTYMWVPLCQAIFGNRAILSSFELFTCLSPISFRLSLLRDGGRGQGGGWGGGSLRRRFLSSSVSRSGCRLVRCCRSRCCRPDVVLIFLRFALVFCWCGDWPGGGGRGQPGAGDWGQARGLTGVGVCAAEVVAEA